MIDWHELKDITSRLGYNRVTFKCEEMLVHLENKENLSEDEKCVLVGLRNEKDTVHSFKPDGMPNLTAYKDWDGCPILLWEFSFKFYVFDRHIEKSLLNGWYVSTVWIGYGLDLPIYETAVFKDSEGSSQNWYSYYMERWETYDEAIDGHAQVCRMIKDGEILGDESGIVRE